MSGTIARSRKRRRSVLQPPSDNHAPLPELPEDLIVEILSWLPVKSLLQFRCVCKSLKTLISSSNFVKNHLHRSATDPNLRLHRLLGRDRFGKLWLSRTLRSLFDNPPSSPTISDLSNHLSFDVPSNILILGSCNGLICWVNRYSYCNDYHYVHYLNPSTRLKSKSPYLRLPRRDDSCFTMFGFGYDHLSDTYKTVAVYCDPKAENIDNKTVVKVYALGGARSWRNMQSFPFVPRFSFDNSGHCGKFVSGTLNWLATRPDGSLVVVSVDIAKETCGEVLLPLVVDKSEEVVHRPELWVLRGCLCFSYYFNGAFNGDQFVLWQMKLYGDTESWTILFNISCRDLGIHHDIFSCHVHFRPRPFFMLDKGELLIENIGDLILYNPRHNSFKYLQFWSYGICLEATTHIDSLVSPCLTRSELTFGDLSCL